MEWWWCCQGPLPWNLSSNSARISSNSACKTTDPHQITVLFCQSSCSCPAGGAGDGAAPAFKRQRDVAHVVVRGLGEPLQTCCDRAFGLVPLTSGCPPLKRRLTLDQVGFKRFGVMLFLGPVKYSSWRGYLEESLKSLLLQAPLFRALNCPDLYDRLHRLTPEAWGALSKGGRWMNWEGFRRKWPEDQTMDSFS